MAPPCSPYAPPTMEAQATLPDHLTEEILLRLPTAADLARVSTAGASLRRIIADHSFLRRFRSIHPPPLLGILSAAFLPAQPPHPSAAAARALTGTDFSCSFLPSSERERWHRCDFRDGRALLFADRNGVPALDKNLAVCDPFHRRYLLLPTIPQDLAALAPDTLKCEPFLAPAGEDEDDIVDAPFSFRVMCLARSATKLVLFVFSSPAGQWDAITFDGWRALIAGHSGAGASSTKITRRCYAHGCICWVIPHLNKLLMFDTRTAEFSSLKLPPGNLYCQMAFVEAREGRLGMITLRHKIQDDACHLSYAILQSNGDGANQWQTEDVIPLPCNCYYNIIGAAGGYLLVQGYAENQGSILSSERPELECFLLNLQTLRLERFCGTRQTFLRAQLYVGYPPSLSPPTI